MAASSPLLFGRQRSLHEILGSGILADVVLWRRHNLTLGILLGTLAAWLVFEVSGYTLVSLLSNVLLLLISILFVWAKAAAVLNRPQPPIPKLYLSEEVMKAGVDFVHSHINTALSSFHDIALGKNWKLFLLVAACLWLISFVASSIGFLTVGYTSLVIVLTVPVMYEKYEDRIEGTLVEGWQRERVYCTEAFSKAKKWIQEKKKL